MTHILQDSRLWVICESWNVHVICESYVSHVKYTHHMHIWVIYIYMTHILQDSRLWVICESWNVHVICKSYVSHVQYTHCVNACIFHESRMCITWLTYDVYICTLHDSRIWVMSDKHTGHVTHTSFMRHSIHARNTHCTHAHSTQMSHVTYVHGYLDTYVPTTEWYGVATVSRIDQMIGLFCKRAL